LYPIKLAVALAIAGGVPTIIDSQTKMRGESHLLLIGDPGDYYKEFFEDFPSTM
jgi:DNA helicase MCM9